MIILRKQKEYNLVTDLYYSGFPRTYKKVVGNARRNIAKKLSKSAIGDIKLGKEAWTKMDTNPLRSGYLRGELEKEANKVGAHVSGLASNKHRTAEVIGKDSLNKEALTRFNSPEKIKKLQKDIAKTGEPNYYIFLGNAGEDSLAHEIGHLRNGQSLNPTTRVINHLANRTGLRNQHNTQMIYDLYNNGETGLINSAKKYVGGRIILSEEKGATKKGNELLKKLGATEREISESKENLTNGYNTYKGPLNADWKMTLRNTIQIPSRKESPILYDLVSMDQRKKLLKTYRIPRLVKINKVD